MMKQKEFYKGNIPKMVEVLSQIFKQDPNYVMATLCANFPSIRDKSKCPHCAANMEMRVYTANLHVGMLLLRMAETVRDNIKKGISFTEANKVHVMSLPASDTTRHYVTWAKYLGFVHQPKEWCHAGHWLITRWGWSALRGDRVPMTAKYYRGQLIERSDATTTLIDMFRTHRDKVESAIARRKAVSADHRGEISTYNPIEWTEFGGYADGDLL